MTALPQDAVADLQQRIAELERQLDTAVNERDAAIERQTASALVNFRLKNELRAVTDRQKASAEILNAIANTHGDAEHALQRIAETTANFFNAAGVTIRIAEGDAWVRTVRVGSASQATGAQPAADFATGGHNMPGTVYEENRQIHIPDLDNIDPSMANWPATAARVAGIRTICGTPLRRGAKAIGALIVYRDRLAPFTDDELALQQSFADQAVIAIENARLFNATHEALERQTATADILKVIASSPSDVQPVFDAIAESANRLIGGYSTSVHPVIDDMVYVAAFTPIDPESDATFKAAFPMPRSETPAVPLIEHGETTQIADAETADAQTRRLSRARGWRSVTFTPLMNRGTFIGFIGCTRREAGLLADHHVELLRTFADQAVIAIENTRLFNETKEALERQTATADILKVIASSPADVQPVFDAIASSSKQLIGGFSATVFRFVDGIVNLAAYTPISPAADKVLTASFPRPTANLPFFELAKGGEVVQEADSETNPDAGMRDIARARGFRSSLFSPLMSKGTPIGLIVVTRKDPGPFAAHHVQLLETFADQAVIAIENTRLFNETQEALERQTATADILKVIASSPSDVQPVFEAIAHSANRLIGGFSSTVYRFVDGMAHLKAFTPTTPEADEILQSSFPQPVADFAIFQATGAGEVMQVPDTEAPSYELKEIARARGYRSMLFVPLMNKGTSIGLIAVTRVQPGTFADHHVQLLKTFADQAVIAIENTRLFTETQEALERQTATADILKVIASSPSDVAPVFEAIVGSAKRLLGGFTAAVFRLIDEDVHLAAYTPTNPAADEALKADFPQPVENFEAFRLAQHGKPFPIPDTEEVSHQPLRDIARLHGFRSMLWVPITNGGKTMGIISVTRVEPGAFAPHHIQLLQTFADQAVIAVENTRLFNETQEALERQTATADILKVIASSPSDVQPVFEAIVGSAARLFEPCAATITTLKDDKLHWNAAAGSIPGFDVERTRTVYPLPFDPERAPSARAILERRIIEFPDVESPDTPEFTRKAAAAGHFRSITFVPLIDQEQGIGTIIFTHPQPGHRFSEKQLALMQTFADQAVIAIGNARLFNEVQERTRDLSESLQQQTATSEVLQIISSSPGDLVPVFDKMLENATRVCGAEFGSMLLVEDAGLRQAALYNAPAALAAVRANRVMQYDPLSVPAIAIRTRQVVQIEDVRTSAAYLKRAQATVQIAELGGARTIVVVPMLRDDEAIGSITVYRQEVRPFSDKQVELLTNFARQAVIAIENARLLRELRQRTDDLSESLEQQTAISDILGVISSSPGDIKPVFQTVARHAAEICEAQVVDVLTVEDDRLVYVAHFGDFERLVQGENAPLNRDTVMGRSIVDKRPVHIADLQGTDHDFALGREYALRFGHRTTMAVPLIRDDHALGTILIRRADVRPFEEKHIALLKMFADQAVIAIENARLLRELRERTDDLSESLQFQTASAEVLKVISRSPDTLQPVLNVIVQTSRELCSALTSVIFLLRDSKFRHAADSIDESFQKPEYIDSFRNNPISPDQVGSILARATREKCTVNIPNTEEDVEAGLGGPLDAGGPKALLCVPLMLDDRIIGAITLRQSHLAPFTRRQIEAVESFADQAVIAISNVNLFEQVQARTRELSKSLDDLRTAQDRLVQTEKLASLGQLTAGIAHEIKNPLNFVNNFAALSAELTDELKDSLKPAIFDETIRAEVDELTGLLKDNLAKVVQHGKRADSIVKNMLLHSREGSGEHRPADVNALVDESLNLAYHGARAEKPQFNVTLQRDFDSAAGTVEVFPQEITRVLLNLISNGFYAVTKRKADNGAAEFEPLVTASTRGADDYVEIRIRDNGTGIPPEVKEKMFNPFFTTKPAGEGTGLGLSMSHDIIVKQHGGTIEVETEPGAFTEFRLVLPRTSLAKSNGNR